MILTAKISGSKNTKVMYLLGDCLRWDSDMYDNKYTEVPLIEFRNSMPERGAIGDIINFGKVYYFGKCKKKNHYPNSSWLAVSLTGRIRISGYTFDAVNSRKIYAALDIRRWVI